jgi:hypothetical protein
MDARNEVAAKLARPAVRDIPVEEIGGAVAMRSPSFAEWHSLVAKHRELDGKAPPTELIVETVAAVLANPDGSRMFTAEEVAEMRPGAVVAVYEAAWPTVLRGVHPEPEAKKA